MSTRSVAAAATLILAVTGVAVAAPAGASTHHHSHHHAKHHHAKKHHHRAVHRHAQHHHAVAHTPTPAAAPAARTASAPRAASVNPAAGLVRSGQATRKAAPSRVGRLVPGASGLADNANFFVATTGLDSATGSATAPWRTVQYAIDHAPAGSVIKVAAGRYAPFTVTRSQTIVGDGANKTQVVGTTSALDGIAVRAPQTTIADLGVVDCVAKNVPGNGYENGGASAISLNAAASYTTIDSVALTGRTTKNSYGLNFGCFGVAVRDADHVTIQHSTITGLGFGVFLRHGGPGTLVTGNTISNNTAMIRNTPAAYDDFGGSAIGFNVITASPGPVVSGNTIENNVAPSHDYGTDGGGFDLYEADNVTITGNTLRNNENVLESGTANDIMCSNVVFSNNIASGRTSASTLKHSVGMYMRCGAGMKVTGNTFSNFDWWTFVIAPQNGNTAALRGLQVTGNTITQGYDAVWAINQSTAGCGYVFDPNTYSYKGKFGVDWLKKTIVNAGALASAILSLG